MRRAAIGMVWGIVAFSLSACAEDGAGEVDTGVAIGRASAGDGPGVVRGRVTREVGVSDAGDGAGTLHIGLASECLASRGTAPTLLAAIAIDADLSDDAAAIPFEISGLRDGVYQASCWLDDVDNPSQDEDLPGKGDLAMFAAATPICVPVVIEAGLAAADVTLSLNYVMPFDLTGMMADDRGGVVGDDGGGEVDPSDIDLSDPNTYSVSVRLTRSVDFGEGGDGKGDAVFTLSDSCFEASGDPPEPRYALEQAGVDLSSDGSATTLTFGGVKNGIYQINGYLDDALPRSAARPLPNNGDLVRFGGFGPGCVQVVVNGGDVAADFDLNFVMTWDLNG